MNEARELASMCLVLFAPDPMLRSALVNVLEDAGAHVVSLSTLDAALNSLRSGRSDILVAATFHRTDHTAHVVRAVRALPGDCGGRTPVVADVDECTPEMILSDGVYPCRMNDCASLFEALHTAHARNKERADAPTDTRKGHYA